MLKKTDVIWNTIGSLVYSLFNAIILIVCTRLNGTEIAGMFSISYATGCILNAIGDWGIRIFQVTDTNRNFKFIDYLFSRLVVVMLMFIIGIIFVLVSGYTNEKMYICIVIIILRIVDDFSESFQAEFQLNNRLDIAGKVLLYRNLVEIIVFAIADYVTKNIYISFGMLLLSSIVMILITDIKQIKKFVKISWKFNKLAIKKILKECLPLAISTIVNMYVINAVKYAIDIHGNNTMQTFFNILYMPTFAINLVSVLAIKSFLKQFGDYWNNKEYNSFVKIIVYMVVLLFGCSIIIEIVCAVVGIQILNLLYGVNLTEYRLELLILVLSGLLYAIATVIFYALGTMRKQKSSTVVYAITAILGFCISDMLVSKYKILGATLSSVIIMLFLMLGMLIVFIYNFNKLKKEEVFNNQNIGLLLNEGDKHGK